MSKREQKRIDKDAFLSIKEFSEAVGISESRLRTYDKLGILPPAKRAGGKNSYRYYSPMQIIMAKMIKVLRELGVSLEEIAELGKERSPDTLIRLFTYSMNDIMARIHVFQERYSVASVYQKQLIDGISADEHKIFVMPMPEVPIVLGEPTAFAGGEGFYNEFRDFLTKPRNPKLNPLYPIGGYFDSFNTFLEHPSEPDRFFSLDPNGRERREKGLYLVGYTRGYYGETNDLPQRMAEYAEKNMITFDGPVFNTYLFDELSIPDPDNYLLQVAASIKSMDYR